MRPQWHRKNLVVWSSSARPSGWPAVTAPRRTRRELRRRVRTGVLVALIGLIRFVRVVRGRPGLAFLLTGGLLVVAGNVLPSGAAIIAGMMISLRGAAVLLGVTEPPRRPGGQPPGGPDFFGFRTPG
jgi:hypothetical protein